MHCSYSVLIVLLVFASGMLQSVLLQLENKTLTLHFAIRTGMCMQSQGHGSLHVWLACSVRGGPPVV